jgi:ribosomal protein S18 acetylase RimI-like enzyme
MAFYADVVSWLDSRRRRAMNRVRPAIMVDAAAIARIDVECWRSTYAGVLSDEFLIDLSEGDRKRVWSSYVARQPGDMVVSVAPSGEIQGFGSCGRRRDSDSRFAGEVFTLYVATDHQGKGLGRALLLGLFVRLVRCNMDSASIWVLRDNPARFFYERLGGKLVSHRKLRVAGINVEAVAYGWRDLAAVLKTQAGTGRLDGDS